MQKRSSKNLVLLNVANVILRWKISARRKLTNEIYAYAAEIYVNKVGRQP